MRSFSAMRQSRALTAPGGAPPVPPDRRARRTGRQAPWTARSCACAKHAHPNPNALQVVGATVAAHDADGDGRLSLPEFRALLAAGNPKLQLA
jgi:hypothetical protein